MTGRPARYKKIAFLVRRPDLTEAAFRRHWRETHGPLVARAPGYAAWRQRYVQTHPLEPAGFGRPFAPDGVAEFWLPSANEDLYARSDTYLVHVRPDELNFVDMDRTVSMTARETVIVPGVGTWKLMLFWHSAALPPADQADAMELRAHEIARALTSRLAGCSLDLALDGSARLPGGRTMSGAVPGAVLTLRFDRPDHLAAAAADPRLPAFLGLADPGLAPAESTTVLLAEEFVFFDGRRSPS